MWFEEGMKEKRYICSISVMAPSSQCSYCVKGLSSWPEWCSRLLPQPCSPQDLVPYMVRSQFLPAPPAAVPARPSEGSAPQGAAAGSPFLGRPSGGAPDAADEGSRGSSAPSENGRSDGELLIAAACERYLGSGSGSGLGLTGSGCAGTKGGGARACGVYMAGPERFCARATSVQAYADINRRASCLVELGVLALKHNIGRHLHGQTGARPSASARKTGNSALAY